MPDHLHLLITLGERLSLSQTVQRFKAKTMQKNGPSIDAAPRIGRGFTPNSTPVYPR